MSPGVEPFFKYHGLGNDFVVVDRRQTGQDLDAATTRRLCDRHFGIGADGVLSILPATNAVAQMVVHNADGSIAQMCGNGLRCVVKHLADRMPERPACVLVQTGAGLLDSQLSWTAEGVDAATVAMGPALLEAPILPNGGPFLDQALEGHRGTAVSMGNPHLVLRETSLDLAARIGPILEHHSAFSERTNVEFVRERPDGGLDVVVWERGVGLTLACGTGACAAVVACALAGRRPFERWVPVHLPGGILDIKVASDRSQVWLRGPVRFVFEGQLP